MGGGPDQGNDPQQMYMKWAMRGLGVAMVPLTYSFPAGVFVYWITTNVFSFGQMMTLKVPIIKKLAAIPDMPQARGRPRVNRIFPPLVRRVMGRRLTDLYTHEAHNTVRHFGL